MSNHIDTPRHRRDSVSLNTILLLGWFIILPLTYVLPISDYLVICLIAISGLKNFVHLAVSGSVRKTQVLSAFALYAVWLIITLVAHDISLRALTRVIQFVGCFLSFFIAMSVRWKNLQFRTIKRLINVILIACIIHWGLSGLKTGNYSFILGNANSFATALFCWAAILLVDIGKQSIDTISVVVCLGLILITSSRGTIFACFVLLTARWLISRWVKRGKDKNFIEGCLLIAFVIELVVLLLFVFVYPSLVGTSLGVKAQELSLRYFRKNFFSGRQDLWFSLTDAIMERPLIGYGLGVLPGDILNTHLSSHNLFLQVALQSGIIGLGLLLLIIIQIFLQCLKRCDNRNCQFVIAFIMALMIHECFEVSLTQNLIVCGMEMWFVLGLGCNTRLMSAGI